ncbi:putative NBD/HSP70 family sugar kinase [Arthrobacter sp. BE255]|nr:putative NBD/HSP70 family sugar kinase [Arthrobacter sp. BE255]
MATTPEEAPQPLPWKGRQVAGRYSFVLQRCLSHVEFLFSPELVIGGGISQRSHDFLPSLKLCTPIVPAVLCNEAGIIGAAGEAASNHLEIPTPT